MSSFSNFTERLESGARNALPYSFLLILLFLNSVAAPFAAAGELKAPFFLMGLYYWSVFRPTLIPPWLAFAAGIIADLMGGLPLGLNACVFVLAQWIISDSRRFLMGQSFPMLWFGFFIMSFLTALLQWILFGLVNGGWPPLKPLGFSILLGLALFPMIYGLLRWTHRILPTLAHGLEPR